MKQSKKKMATVQKEAERYAAMIRDALYPKSNDAEMDALCKIQESRECIRVFTRNDDPGKVFVSIEETGYGFDSHSDFFCDFGYAHLKEPFKAIDGVWMELEDSWVMRFGSE